LVVGIVGVIVNPLADYAVSWAGLSVACNLLVEHWASSTTKTGWSNDGAELITNTATARSRAETIPVSCVKVATIASKGTGICVVAIIGGPFTDNTIDRAVEAVAFDLLGQWGAVKTSELCIGNDTTVDGTETSGSTSSRAETAEELATVEVA